MNKINFKRNILPHLVAVIVFFLITILFFQPLVFENKVISQQDIDQWRGGAQELIEYREKTGEEGLWTNSMFSGMPAYFVNTEWSDKPILFIKQVISLGLEHPISNIMVAFVCYYIMLISFRVRPYLAIIGAVAFGLSSFNIIGLAAGHNARIGAIAFMPLVIAGIHLIYTRSRLIGFGLAAAGTALELRESHLQITYYLLIIILFYALIQLITFYKEKELKQFFVRSGICIAAALIAVLAYSGHLWSTLEYSEYSMRGPSDLTAENVESEGGLQKDYAFQYSNGIFEPFTLFIPNILGGASANFLVQDEDSETLKALQRSENPQMANQLVRFSSAYWGEQPGTAPYYAGAISCFLFALGIAFAEKKYVYWLVAVTIIGIILSWGDNFKAINYFLFDHLPLYNKFRSVTFTMLLPVFAIPFLGLLGLDRLLDKGWDKAVKKKTFIAIGIIGGLCLFIALISGVFSYERSMEEQLPMWFRQALQDDRQGLLLSDTFRALIFVALAATVIWLHKTKKLGYYAVAGTLILLTTVDMWSVSKRYFGEDNYRRERINTFTQPLPVDQAILRDQDLSYRVYNLQGAWNEARTSYFHKSLGGYHGAKLRRVQELYDYCLLNETQELIDNLRAGQRDLAEYGVINMLNARYLVFGQQENNYIKNDAALGNAWIVNDIVKVSSPDEAIRETCQVDTRRQAVVNINQFELSQQNFNANGSVVLTSYAPNELVYTAQLSGDAFVIFSEIYYPAGWKALIDDQPVDIKRANFVLRALEVPQGQHTIRFTFEPDSYILGNKITMAGSWAVVLALFISLGLGVFRHLKRTDQ